MDRAGPRDAAARVRARIAELHRAGSPVLLPVDEAHALPGETREQFRLLAQPGADGERMLNVIADKALLSAAMDRRHQVGARDVAAAADDIKLSRPRTGAPRWRLAGAAFAGGIAVAVAIGALAWPLLRPDASVPHAAASPPLRAPGPARSSDAAPAAPATAPQSAAATVTSLSMTPSTTPSTATATPRPAASQPAASQPAASQPAASQPAASQPAASQSVVAAPTGNAGAPRPPRRPRRRPLHARRRTARAALRAGHPPRPDRVELTHAAAAPPTARLQSRVARAPRGRATAVPRPRHRIREPTPMDAERLNQTQSLIDDLRARLGELRRYL